MFAAGFTTDIMSGNLRALPDAHRLAGIAVDDATGPTGTGVGGLPPMPASPWVRPVEGSFVDKVRNDSGPAVRSPMQGNGRPVAPEVPGTAASGLRPLFPRVHGR